MNPLLWSIPGRIPTCLFFAVLPPDPARPEMERLGACLQRAHRLRGAAIARDRKSVV